MKEEKKGQAQDEKTKGGKAAGTIVNIVLVLAIVFAFICTYTSYTTKKGSGVPNLFGYEPFSIQTNSMSPFFDAGDLVISKTQKSYSSLEVGQIITFWTIINGERVLNTHRIIEVVPGETFTYYYTKGDNNSQVDALTVHESEIVGVYQTHIKKVGTALDFMQTPKGFFLIVVLPVFLFFVYYIVSFFRVLFEYQGQKKRLEFEKEYAEREVAAPAQKDEGSETITMTKEQLLELLQKAEAKKEEKAEVTEEAKAEVKAEVEEVKEEAKTEAEEVKEEAKADAEEVKEEAKAEAKEVIEEVKAETEEVKEEAKAEAKEVIEEVKAEAEEVKEEAKEEI